MCFKNVSWLYSGLKELSSVASSFVSFMSIVILSSHCDALDPKASTPIKNPGFARVHPGRHDTRFRRVEAPTSMLANPALCRAPWYQSHLRSPWLLQVYLCVTPSVAASSHPRQSTQVLATSIFPRFRTRVVNT